MPSTFDLNSSSIPLITSPQEQAFNNRKSETSYSFTMNSNHNNIGHINFTQVTDHLWGNPDKESKLKTLSNRQLECLLLLVKGITIKQIA